MSKVMVIDDSEIVREMARGVLEDGGYEVFTLDTPFGFSQAVREEKPDLVMVDVNMPGLSGDKVVEIFTRRGQSHCPIVFYSERSEADLQNMVVTAGAAGYIQKKSGADGILSTVKKLIG